MKSNIKMISDLTGYSPATISNAFSRKRSVSKDAAEKIFKTAQEIGYFPKLKISNVKVVIYKKSGAIVNDSPFFSALLSGVEAECQTFGYNTVMCNLVEDAPDYDNKLEELLNDPSSALLILATELDEAEARRFQSALAPVVLLDNWYEYLKFNAVLIDNTDAAIKAVTYLANMGHRHIGYLRGSVEIKNFYYRCQGYVRALRECGLTYESEYTFSLTPSMEGSYGDMAEILRHAPKLPTAFFADNDMIALGAMRALQQNGYRVPEDVSIVGFDDLPYCAVSSPPLTTVKVYNSQMGRAAVRRLKEIIDYGDTYRSKVQITSSFVERDSVRDLRNGNTEGKKAI